MTPVLLSDGSTLTIRRAAPNDTALILDFIRKLAEYEKLSHEVVTDEAQLRKTLFGERPYAEVLIADRVGAPVAFAIYFHSYSTFLGRPGLYLEDLFVIPEMRGLKIGQFLLSHLAEIAEERGCGRFEWSVLDWNSDAISFYEKLGARRVTGWYLYRMVGDALQRLAKLPRAKN